MVEPGFEQCIHFFMSDTLDHYATDYMLFQMWNQNIKYQKQSRFWKIKIKLKKKLDMPGLEPVKLYRW